MENGGRQNPHHRKAWLVTITFSLLSLQVAFGQNPGLAWQRILLGILMASNANSNAPLTDRQAASVLCELSNQEMLSQLPWFSV